MSVAFYLEHQIGVSLGALTLFEALTTLAESSTSKASPLVDTAIFVSLPAAPADGEWKKARSAVSRSARSMSLLTLRGIAE